MKRFSRERIHYVDLMIADDWLVIPLITKEGYPQFSCLEEFVFISLSHSPKVQISKQDSYIGIWIDLLGINGLANTRIATNPGTAFTLSRVGAKYKNQFFKGKRGAIF